MQPLLRVLVLVERGAVKADETMGVVREMMGRPVEDHAEARRMAGVDETREAGGVAVAGGRRKQRQRLVAPGAAERIFGNGQEFDMREAQRGGVARQAAGRLVPVRLGLLLA